jgi:hypothetical protein
LEKQRKHIRFSTRFCCWSLLVFMSFSAPAGEWQFYDVSRVVAVSDVHGDYHAMVTTFSKANVIDEELNWVGGDTHLVITGDLLDRGPDSRQVMDLIMRLEGQATEAGGRVHQLIGNHEVMNLAGDLRYVVTQEYAAFAGEESSEEREKWYQHYKSAQLPEIDEATSREAFDSLAPPGFFGHRRAFRTDGKYGKWLLEKPLMVVIDGTAFVHGGVSPYVAQHGLEGVNGTLKTELYQYVTAVNELEDKGLLSPVVAFYDHTEVLTAAIAAQQISGSDLALAETVIGLNRSEIHGSNSPLWYRGNVGCSELIETDVLQAAFDRIGANRVVIGHTPTMTRQILQRMSGRVVEIDTGMNKAAYKGSGNALVIEGGVLTVINESGKSNSPPALHPRRVGYRSSEITADDLLQILSTGEITRTMVDENGKTVVQIEIEDKSIFAAFVEQSRKKGVVAEMAAYKLDLMLGLDLVPVTVIREVDRKNGTLQFLPAVRKTETERMASGSGGSAWCPLQRQWNAMYIFDALTFNAARTQESMMYRPDNWQLFSMGYDQAFRNSKDRPPYLKKIELDLTPGWTNALRGLSDERLQSELGDVLGKRELSALRKRRDGLIKEANNRKDKDPIE